MKTISLLERLTDTDRLELQERQNSAISAARRLIAAEKVRRATYRAELKSLDQERDSINDQLMTGKMSKDVAVEERIDYRAGRAFTFRLDTGVEVAVRDIAPGERQEPLPLTNAAADRTEEQEVAETPEEAEATRAARLASQRASARAATAAKTRVDTILSKIIVLLPNESGNGKFTAKVGAIAGFPWGETGCSSDGETTDEARAKLTSFMLAKVQDQEEELDKRWLKSIQPKIDEIVAGAKFELIDASDEVVAEVSVGGKTVSGTGREEAGAIRDLRGCVVEALREEVAELARAQAADATKGGRRGLKAPPKKLETEPEDTAGTAF